MTDDPRVEILKVRINVTNLDLAVKKISGWIEARQKNYVCVAPVATVMDCQDDPEYRRIVNEAGMTTPDGMPLVWLGRLKGNAIMGRTYGPDLMAALCRVSEEKGYRHYFYGGSPETNRLLLENLKHKFPRLNIAGGVAPRFLQVKEMEERTVLDQINASGADILWVGLGSPKQDYWMALHREKISIPVMIGAGAAFDFLAGTKPQAPRWMQRSGLEWLFRLLCEPRRLWRRYLIGNLRFIVLVLRDMVFPNPRRSS